MNIMKQQFINIQNYNKSSIYSEEIIYFTFIVAFNFIMINQYQMNDFKISKPSNLYYNKSLSLKQKIKVLKEMNIFSQEMMMSAIQNK